MSSRISAREECACDGPEAESVSASFLRGKPAQGKARFGKLDGLREWGRSRYGEAAAAAQQLLAVG